MGFGEAVAACFRNYVKFSGRARRPEYWWFVLFYLLAALILVAIDIFVLAELGLPPLLVIIFALVCILPSLAVTWRRLHDVGRSGWWSLLPSAVSLIGSGVVLAVVASGGQASPEAFQIAGIVNLVFSVISLILTILLIVWLASRSQRGPNRFGPEPGAEVQVDGVFE